MAMTEALKLVIDADARGAVKAITQVGNTADKELGKADQRIQKLGKGMQKVGAGMVASGALMVGGLYKLAKASEEADLEHRKFENTLANAPQLAGASRKAFYDLADSLQDTTTAEGDAL